ncbi:DUF4198 domain-containing protein [Asticcacaulis sp. AC460]|uniref:DUF4198 domain-containing protein n=1 Tax=Asticcacaulis sp. AC460 TaxID=1282360 RepID=UPI000401E1C6|nr:DUF4198 domain-containing protein [Asticcacaulis sp. AC460]
MTSTISRYGFVTPYTRETGKPMRRRWGFALALAIAGAALPAMAHDFWLQPERFRLKAGAATPMTFQVGHGKDRQKSLIARNRVVRFDSLSAAGHADRRGELKMGDANADTVLKFPARGLQLLAFETDGAYSELPAIRFNDYLKAEGLTTAMAWRAQKKTVNAPGRETYSRRAKALVQVGDYARADDAIATRRLGLALEIVPEVNPYAPEFTGSLPVRVYYQGQPLAGAMVRINNLDFDSRPLEVMTTDAAGRAVFKIPKTGSWQLNVVWTKPVQGNPKAEFDTIFSSLTLGFTPG